MQAGPWIRRSLPRADIRNVFQKFGRVHVPGFLVESVADAMHAALAGAQSWQLAVNRGDQHLDLSSEQLRQLPDPSRVLLIDEINRNARGGFQYIFNSIPLHDLHEQGKLTDSSLHMLYACVSSTEFIEFAREVTGCSDIAYADAQATLYRPGHFLTVHDDNVAAKNRRVAYVLSLTREWRVDWGGVLQFIDADGHVAEGYTPKFNALNLFRVPQKHCVSYVAPAAAVGRYSITGWLRTR